MHMADGVCGRRAANVSSTKHQACILIAAATSWCQVVDNLERVVVMGGGGWVCRGKVCLGPHALSYILFLSTVGVGDNRPVVWSSDSVMAFPNAWTAPAVPAADSDTDEGVDEEAANAARVEASFDVAPAGGGGGGAAAVAGGSVGGAGGGPAPVVADGGAIGLAAHAVVNHGGCGVSVWAVAALMGDRCSTALNDLADQRRDLRTQREEVNHVTRSEERKRARILERARNLSNDDLLEILTSRAVAKAKAKPKAKGAAKCKATAKAKASAASAAGAAEAPAGGG